MFFILIFLSIFSNPRSWIIPTFSHGEVKNNLELPNYEKDSREYKILQLALDIENLVMSHKIDLKYKDVFFSVLPKNKKLQEIILTRNKNYSLIRKLKKEKHVLEGNDGFLSKTKGLSKENAKILENENNSRKKLYALINNIIKNDEDIKNNKDKDSKESKNKNDKNEKKVDVNKIYAKAIINFKIYSLKETNSPKAGKNSFLTYMISNYSSKDIINSLLGTKSSDGLLKEQGFVIDTSKDYKINVFLIKYACKDNELDPNIKAKTHGFLLKYCPIKESKIHNCNLKDKIFSNIAVKDGTLVIIYKYKDSQLKSLTYSNDISEDLELMLCKNSKFTLIEDLSKRLLNAKKSDK